MRRLAPTSPESADSPRIVIVPLGSWEQHGPHLPLDTDTVIINAVVSDALERVASADLFVVAPTLAITASDEHAGFAGGLSMGTQATCDALVSIGRSSVWSAGLCLVNGHGGNAAALSSATSALTHEGIRHSVWSLPHYDGADMHAGRTETSLMLHIAPESVRTDRIEPGFDGDRTEAIDTMRLSGVRSVAPNGILGDPTGATAAHGREVLRAYSTHLSSHLDSLAARWFDR